MTIVLDILLNVTRLRSVGRLKHACSLIAVATLLSLHPVEVLACACCAEPGAWFERSEKIGNSELGELDQLKFSPLAKTAMTAAGVDGIKGIVSPSESYTLSVAQTGRRLTLKFRDAQGANGTLSFSVPITAESFGADLHDASDAGTGPQLYKEWRFAGSMDGSGIFKKGITPNTRYRLILQGRGNNCRNASDFKNWILQVNGTRASYAFYGTFS